MKEIQLTKGQFAIVDDEDYELVSSLKWYAYKRVHKSGVNYYAQHKFTKNKKCTFMKLHTFLLGNQPIGFEIDHINGNSLDNRRCNLRVCTHSQNMMNTRKRNNASSKYKGVQWNKHASKFRSMIMINGNNIFLGYFINEDDAALAYNNAAIKLHGEFAKINEIKKPCS